MNALARTNFMDRLRRNETVAAREFEMLFPTENERMLIGKMFPDARVLLDCDVPRACLEAFLLKNSLTIMPRRTSSKGTVAKVPVLFKTDTDGSVEVFLPAGTPPDTAGFNRNRARQMERKRKIAARLKAELERKEEK